MSASNLAVLKPLMRRLTLEIPETALAVLVFDGVGSIKVRFDGDWDRIERDAAGEMKVHRDGNLVRIQIDLPRGLYIVRVSRCGLFKETPVRLDSDWTLRVEPPPHFSAATVPTAKSTHEYYTYAAWKTSYRSTGPKVKWNGPCDARLLLFVRAPGKESYNGEDLLASLTLRTPQGETLADFQTGVRSDREAGWAAYSVRVSPGLLVLEDGAPRPRQIPVPLIRGWQTQLFVMHRRYRLWEDLRVATVSLRDIASRGNRDPYDGGATDVAEMADFDLGLLALQNNVQAVAGRLVETFVNSKFRNPILGLLGAYLLLLRARESDAADPPLYRSVLDYLGRLLPGSADVRALHLVAREWLGPPPSGPVDGIPLFRRGAEILIDAAAEDPSLLPEGSLLDAISEHLYGDTVWTTWHPVALPGAARPSVSEVAVFEAAVDSESSWVDLAVADAVASAERRGAKPAVEDIVRQVGVSPYSFRRAFDRLVTRASNIPPDLQKTGGALHLLAGDIARQVASKFGSRVGTGMLPQIALMTQEDTEAASPSIHTIYAGVKRTLADVAHVKLGTILADTELTNLVDTGDIRGKINVRHQLQRQFGNANLRLSVEDLGTAHTVRDLAHLIKERIEG